MWEQMLAMDVEQRFRREAEEHLIKLCTPEKH